jgi:hypothetical protein
MSSRISTSRSEINPESNARLEHILDKWSRIKAKIEALQEQQDKYKAEVAAIMASTGRNSLQAGQYKVVKRTQTRSILSKDNVPLEIWQRYAQKSQYDVYTLSRIGTTG